MSLTKEVKLEVIESMVADLRIQVRRRSRLPFSPKDQRPDRALRTHPKDHSISAGLLKLVGRRRRFLDYLQKGHRGLPCPHQGARTAPIGAHDEGRWKFERAPTERG